ncbi:MAG: hypothetical protein HUK20_09660 [Fibrobacter sp.]|nr:hypothetical protein [Fibrobacter sp.]
MNEQIQQIRNRIANLHFDYEASQKSLNTQQEVINRIVELDSVDQFQIVFIGRPGSGKTTAICNWLDLIHIANQEHPTKSHDLLSTGSGNTTVAEIRLKQVQDESRILLEYPSIENQIKTIEECCELYYRRCKGIKAAEADEGNPVPTMHQEINRLIRNMAGLINPEITEKKDERISYVNSFNSLEDFTKAQLDKINLESRQCTKIPYTDGDFKTWLYETFKKINFGYHQQCSIPTRISIEINRNDLDMQLPPFVNEIIDTLGLDTDDSARVDLQKFLKNKNTICVLVDEINNPPSLQLSNLLKNTFIGNYQYLNDKVALYVRVKGDELGKVPEANGDETIGEKIKRSQIADKVDNLHLPYNVANTIFMDSKKAYCISILPTYKNGAIIKEQLLEYIPELATDQRKYINECFSSIIERYKGKLFEEAIQVNAYVNELEKQQHQFKQDIIDQELRRICNTLEQVKSITAPTFIENDVVGCMINSLVPIHWNTIKAMTRRYGGYESYKIDVYTEFAFKAKIEYNKKIQALKTNFQQALQSDNTDAQLILQGYKSQINSFLEISVEDFFQELLNTLLNRTRMYPQESSNAFWIEAQGVHGFGFKDRIIDTYKKGLEPTLNDFRQLWKTLHTQIFDKTQTLFPSTR